MVLNAKKDDFCSIPTAKFTRGQISALVEHEIGVHMVTTVNSNARKSLHLFNLGLPVNTMTQEGLGYSCGISQWKHLHETPQETRIPCYRGGYVM